MSLLYPLHLFDAMPELKAHMRDVLASAAGETGGNGRGGLVLEFSVSDGVAEPRFSDGEAPGVIDDQERSRLTIPTLASVRAVEAILPDDGTLTDNAQLAVGRSLGVQPRDVGLGLATLTQDVVRWLYGQWLQYPATREWCESTADRLTLEANKAVLRDYTEGRLDERRAARLGAHIAVVRQAVSERHARWNDALGAALVMTAESPPGSIGWQRGRAILRRCAVVAANRVPPDLRLQNGLLLMYRTVRRRGRKRGA